MSDYREQIYASYSRMFQERIDPITEKQLCYRIQFYTYHFRKWMPEDKDAEILDVGCGAGDLLAVFKRIGFSRLHGVDLSLPQVELARQIIKDVTHGNAIDYLKEHKGAFDLITALDIIEHFKKDEALDFLDACFVGLRPGGRIIFQTPNAESPWGGAINCGDITHETCYTAEGLGRILRMCGFVDIESHPCGPIPRGLKSFIRWILWQAVRMCFTIYNTVEGHSGSGIYTRVFIITGKKPFSAEKEI